MQNRKLMLLNIVMFVLILVVVVVGKNTWTSNYQSASDIVVAEEQTQEHAEIKDRKFAKKKEEDFEQFIQPEVNQYNPYGVTEENQNNDQTW